MRFLRRLIRKLTCRRHRWRPDRRRGEGREFCDLCGARRQVAVQSGRTA